MKEIRLKIAIKLTDLAVGTTNKVDSNNACK